MQRSHQAFTLVEVIVAIGVLTLLVVFVARLFDAASALIASHHKQMDADGQARLLFDQLAIDFSQLIKRSDLDYYLKSPGNPQTKDQANNPTGNDQLAFYCLAPGYYPSTGSPSPVSIISHRINDQFNAERLTKGLAWNGVSSADPPMVFLPRTIAENWPAAANNGPDADYQIVSPNVVRFEYSYLLGSGESSDTPWDTSKGHSTINGLHDVVAISVAIATIDSRGRVLLSDQALEDLTRRMIDFATPAPPGTLVAQWEAALDRSNDLPRAAISGIRIYQRTFELKSMAQ